MMKLHRISPMFLALHKPKPVGIAVCFLGFSTFAARPLLNIHDLAVMPEYRGQGVGRQLLEHVEIKGRALECCMLTLEVREDNHWGQQLDHNVGFDVAKVASGPVRNWFLEIRLQVM